MSIHNLSNKIKDSGVIDKTSILYLIIIAGVGVSAFGLGRLSMSGVPAPMVAAGAGQVALEARIDPLEASLTHPAATSSPQAGMRYLASKNGKLYYTAGCSAAKRISVKNTIWFTTAREAEYEGYKPSPSCK